YAEAHEAQRGNGGYRGGDVYHCGGDDGADGVRDDVLHDYAHDAAALDAHGLNVLLVYELEHLRPHQAHLLRDERDSDDEHQVHVCRRHHSRQRYHQYQDRQGHDHVKRTHYYHVHCLAEIG